MKSKIIKKELANLLKHLKYYNKLAPFPVYDTDYVKDVEDKINIIMKDKHKDYDDEPVVACKYCKSLHIVSDEIDNNICIRCGSVNELQEFKDINEYLKLKNGFNKES